MCRNKDSFNYGFHLLVKKYQNPLYWHIRRMVIDHEDAADLVQDTFVKVWKNIGKFREDSKLFTWMYRIATNEALSFLSNKKKKLMISFSKINDHLENKLESDIHFTGDEIQKKFQMALLILPEKQRLVFNMKYFEELKYEDISEILGTSVGALKASYHIAVKKIEKYLREN